MKKVLYLIGVLCSWDTPVFSQADSLVFDSYFRHTERIKSQADKLDSALYWADLMLHKAHTPYQIALAHYAKGEVIASNHWTYNTGEYAFDYYVKAINGFIETKQRERLHHALNALALTYERKYTPNNSSGVSSKYILYTQMAFRIQHDPSYDVTATFKAALDDKPASKKELLEAIKITKDNLMFWKSGINAPPHQMWRSHTLGKLYWELDKNMNNAEEYFVKSADIAKQIKDELFHSICLGSLAVYHNQAHNYQKALTYSELGLKHAVEILKIEFREAIFRDQLYLAYKAIGQMSHAIMHKERALAIAEKVYRETEVKGLTLMRERNVALQKQIQLEQQINQQQQRQNWYLLGVFLLASSLIYIFYNNHQLRQKNAAISAALLQGQATERKRLADDLHDNLGSTMSALRWSMEAINPQKLTPQEQEVYRHVQSTIAQAHNQVRLLSHNLLPEELEKQGLWEGLQQLVRKLNRNTSVKWVLTLPQNPPRLDAKTEFELYSIVLELTNNVLKHAQATTCDIVCKRIGDKWQISVSDNGVGMAEKRVNGKGMNSVESRVKSLNGQLHIHTQAGEGTRFEVWV